MAKPIPYIASIAAVSLLSGAIAYQFGYKNGSENRIAPKADSIAQAAASEDAAVDPILEEAPRQDAELAPSTATPEIQQTPGNSEIKTLGYQDAGTDLAAALETAKTLTDPQRAQYLQGLFTRVAKTLTPTEALTIASSLDSDLRNHGLKTLVSEWIHSTGDLSEEQLRNFQNRTRNLNRSYLGLEVDLASILSRANVDASVKQAWAKSFESHLGRSEIQARLFAGGSPQEIEAAFAASKNWTSWEQNRFAESFLRNWSRKDATEAWQWYSENRNEFPSDQTDRIISAWAFQKPEDLIQNLDAFQTAQERQGAIEAISKSLARKDTQEALEWAESLEDVNEQAAAYQAVYKATPKGIGAMVRVQDGFPQINQIIPGGALEETHIQAGDLLVEASEDGQEPINLYGRNLRETINELRGPPGSTVNIKVLRQNPESGQIEEHTATVTRDLLILGQQED